MDLSINRAVKSTPIRSQIGKQHHYGAETEGGDGRRRGADPVTRRHTGPWSTSLHPYLLISLLQRGFPHIVHLPSANFPLHQIPSPRPNTNPSHISPHSLSQTLLLSSPLRPRRRPCPSSSSSSGRSAPPTSISSPSSSLPPSPLSAGLTVGGASPAHEDRKP